MIPAVVERCAGIDVGKKTLAVCVMTGAANEEPQAELRKFGTVRAELIRLCEWLKSAGCTHVVMESTGCYWKPILVMSSRLCKNFEGAVPPLQIESMKD